VAHARDAARTYGKSAPIDALAVVRARFANRTCRRHASTGQSGSCASSSITVRWHLHELDPNFEPPARSLWRKKHVRATEALLERHDSLVALLARELLRRIGELSTSITELDKAITLRVTALAPSLLEIDPRLRDTHRCEDRRRGRRRDAVSAQGRLRSTQRNRTAPLPVWSGNRVRHRRARTGNRQLNAAIHRIAITQAHYHPDARAYLERRRAGGDTKIASLSGLKWRLSDVRLSSPWLRQPQPHEPRCRAERLVDPLPLGNELFVSGGGGTPVAMAQGLNAAAWIGCASRRGPDGRRTARPDPD
jgi:transposase